MHLPLFCILPHEENTSLHTRGGGRHLRCDLFFTGCRQIRKRRIRRRFGPLHTESEMKPVSVRASAPMTSCSSSQTQNTVLHLEGAEGQIKVTSSLVFSSEQKMRRLLLIFLFAALVVFALVDLFILLAPFSFFPLCVKLLNIMTCFICARSVNVCPLSGGAYRCCDRTRLCILILIG